MEKRSVDNSGRSSSNLCVDTITCGYGYYTSGHRNVDYRTLCTCNDRDICVFTENKSAQMTYVFTCQERTSSNENRFLFPSSFNGR